jgi:DNA-directed RNA polymerase beta subunit
MISAHQARERLVSYKAKLQVRIRWTVSGPDGETANYEDVRDCGQLPVMVKVCLHVYSSVSFCAELPACHYSRTVATCRTCPRLN